MNNLGDFRAGDTIDFKFCTVTTTGAPTQLAGTPAISVYKSNSTTQSTTGITLTVDFDSVTGLNHVRITTGSDGTFYADANDFDVVITTGTVGGTSVVGYVVAHFSLENRSALRAATAGRELVVDAAGLADANVVKVGPTGSGTAQTAGDIIGDTNDIQTRLPAALVSGRIDASVGAMAANVITAAATAADFTTEVTAGLATAANQTTIIGYIDTEVAAILAAVDTEVAAIKAVTDLLPNAGALTSLATQASVNTIDDFLDTEIAAILAAVDTEVAAIKAKTDLIPAAPAAVGDVPTAVQNADALLGRNIAGGSSTGRLVKDALRFLRNKFTVVGTTLTVYQEDDSTTAWTATVTQDPTADPITGSDPS